jgi:predicted TIM-barrel fold metal-dependent hydrolase
LSGTLDPAPATAPGEVIDAHTHLFTLGLLREFVEAMKDPPLRFTEAIRKGKFGRRGDVLPDMSPGDTACWYLERLRAAGVSKALVMSIAPDNEWTRDFLLAAAGHVHALCNIDPFDPNGPALLEREVAAGFRGVKLLPVNRCYRLSEPACRPFFEKVAELGVHVTIHYGVTVDPTGDLRFADPIDLSPVARDFPDTTFVIAHFGAGWLDSVLRLGYQCKNVCVDTSGTNNWMDHHVPKMTLGEVFERALTALGPERVLFGTDSGTTAPYRTWIKYQQLGVLDKLGLSAAERDLVVRGNAVRVFRLDEPLVP